MSTHTHTHTQRKKKAIKHYIPNIATQALMCRMLVFYLQ